MKIGTCVRFDDAGMIGEKLGRLAANGFDNCQIVSWNPALWTAENAAECPSVRDVAAAVAELRGMALEDLERIVDENAEQFLGSSRKMSTAIDGSRKSDRSALHLV